MQLWAKKFCCHCWSGKIDGIWNFSHTKVVFAFYWIEKRAFAYELAHTKLSFKQQQKPRDRVWAAICAGIFDAHCPSARGEATFSGRWKRSSEFNQKIQVLFSRFLQHRSREISRKSQIIALKLKLLHEKLKLRYSLTFSSSHFSRSISPRWSRVSELLCICEKE